MLLEDLCPVLLQVPKYFGLADFFLPNILLIYILCRSQTYCTRPKDDFHSVILVFVPAQNILEQHYMQLNFWSSPKHGSAQNILGPVGGQGIRKMFRSSDPTWVDPSVIGNRPSVVRPKGQPLGTYRLFRTQNNGLYLDPNQPETPKPTPNPPTTTPDSCPVDCFDCGFEQKSCRLVPGTQCTFRCLA